MSRPIKKYRGMVRGYVTAPANHDFMGAFDSLRAIAARFPIANDSASPMAPKPDPDVDDIPLT